MASILLLALAQAATPSAATLPAEGRAAGLACAAAVGVAGDRQAGPIDLTAQVAYFLMQAAKASPGTGSFAARTEELTAELTKSPAPTAADAKGRLELCYRRWPAAQGKTPVTLPDGRLPRGLMCVQALGILMGAAKGLAEAGDRSAVTRYEPVLQRWTENLTDSYLAAQGIKSDADTQAAIGVQMQASLALGNARAIADACATATPTP